MAIVQKKTHFVFAIFAAFIDAMKRAWSGGAAGGVVSGSSAAGSNHTHTFTGTAPSAAVGANLLSGTGFTTAGQVVTTSDNQTVTLNQYANCWLLTATHAPCLIVSHPAATGAPVAFTVYGEAPATTAEGYRVVAAPTPAGTNANEGAHTHGAGSFTTAPASSAVHFDRGEYTCTTADATNLATSLALTKALITLWNKHRLDALAHGTTSEGGRDTDNTVASTVADVVDLTTAVTAANELKTAYNAHRTRSNTHAVNDTTNAVSSSDASDQSSLNTLLNEIKTDFNAHIADGMLPPSLRVEE